MDWGREALSRKKGSVGSKTPENSVSDSVTKERMAWTSQVDLELSSLIDNVQDMAATRAEPSKESSCKLAGKADSAGQPLANCKGWMTGSLYLSFSVLLFCFLFFPKSLNGQNHLYPTVHLPTLFRRSYMLLPHHFTPWDETQV